MTTYFDLDFHSGPHARIELKFIFAWIEKFNDDRAFLDVQMSGPLDSDIIHYESLLIRGMAELKEVLMDYYEDNLNMILIRILIYMMILR